MRYFLVVITLAFCLNSVYAQRGIRVDRGEARAAYQYLNQIRQNPEKYRRALKITSLNRVTRSKLVWNNTLAKVAEARAYDMARRNYFDHVNPDGIGPNYYINKAGYKLNPDWLKRKSNNNFESIAANHASGRDAIDAFIIGYGSAEKMHRKHLLGMDKWNSSLHDVGIGFVRVPRGATYKTYICVIIAKHNW